MIKIIQKQLQEMRHPALPDLQIMFSFAFEIVQINKFTPRNPVAGLLRGSPQGSDQSGSLQVVSVHLFAPEFKW